MTIVDLRQDIFLAPGAFVSVRTGLMLRISRLDLPTSKQLDWVQGMWFAYASSFRVFF
jgi:hypothetical protein